ncbi:heavy metal-binding domain-containing protein [Lutibacter aestuarii]|uniref:Heavy metal-binding domain-containing protein n=1 Tax=Lutibacter aestuarii TaxID=861111 RepID=A0ABW2Z1V1_9FLAO|nr:heavy metal-binding domain-containing protein [uncultured Lutibacter sp.]
MKKSILAVVAIFSFMVVFTSCKETKKSEVKEETHMENHEHKDGEEHKMSSNDVFQCPMDCEKGKTYDEKGSCPVCKMDLKIKSGDTDMEHAEGCKCKEGGECKCEEGKCECKTEVASKEMDCTKCEEGKCECKA